jgi:hypothetical protein
MIALHRMSNIRCREVDPFDARRFGALGKGKRQTAGAASGVKNGLIVAPAAKIEERLGETAAPSSHLQLVTVSTRRHECR